MWYIHAITLKKEKFYLIVIIGFSSIFLITFV